MDSYHATQSMSHPPPASDHLTNTPQKKTANQSPHVPTPCAVGCHANNQFSSAKTVLTRSSADACSVARTGRMRCAWVGIMTKPLIRSPLLFWQFPYSQLYWKVKKAARRDADHSAREDRAIAGCAAVPIQYHCQ